MDTKPEFRSGSGEEMVELDVKLARQERTFSNAAHLCGHTGKLAAPPNVIVFALKKV